MEEGYMQKRSEIEEKYKWDLSRFVKDDKDIEDIMKYIKDRIPSVKQYYGKLGDKSMLLKMLQEGEDDDKYVGRLGFFLYNMLQVDDSNTKYLKYSQMCDVLSQESAEAGAFVYPQLLELSDEYLDELINDKELWKHKRYFMNIKRDKAHKLSEYDSQFLSKMSLCLGNDSEVYETLTTSEIQFDDALDSEGNKHIVNHAEMSKLIDSPDRVLRKNAFKSMRKGYADKNKTISQLYINDMRLCDFNRKLRKFNSYKEWCLYGEEVPENVYNKLIEQINLRASTLQYMVDLRKKYLGYEDVAYWDIIASVGNDKVYTVEQAIEWVKECTGILGEEYRDLVAEKFNQRAIDYLPNKNKQNGGYSWSIYGYPSVICMNFVEDFDSVSTLAHEMGHAIHSEFSNRNQPIQLVNYDIFVAEVASTVNQILLNLHVRKTATKEENIALIFEFLDNVSGTIFKQTLFSEFEDFAHSQVEQNIPLTYEDLNNKYYELNQKYYGKSIELPEELKYDWSRIPHFYTPFYVYKYATGFVSALCIVQNLLEDGEYYKKYINFLKSGCSKSSVELLQDIGVDLTTDEPYNKAFKFVDNILKELNQILN